MDTAAQQQKAQFLADNLNSGEIYAGLILGKGDEPDYHLVLLPGRDNKTFTWQAAVATAQAAGGLLPTRRELSLLFANCREHFEPSWYWSSESHEGDAAWAWSQYFINGGQYDSRKDFSLRAVAVRRLFI